jgi:phage gp36-like protein
MAYCGTEDLLLGNVPLPGTAMKYVTDAADEIDSNLGAMYVTPIVLDENVPAQRSGFLLLKRINAWLASGRLLMALDAAGEDDQVHQYAKYLVDGAMLALQKITDGSITIPGAEPVNPDVPRVTGPMASWGDDTSPVEAFDNVFGNAAADATRRQQEYPVYYGSRHPLAPYTW